MEVSGHLILCQYVTEEVANWDEQLCLADPAPKFKDVA